MHSPATLSYFCAPPGHFWEWDAEVRGGNQAAVWSDDRSTIAVRAEIEEVLEALAPEGLPPLGAVLLVLAAASANWDAGAVRRRIWEAAQRATGHEDVPTSVLTMWRHVGYGLDQIHRLPDDLRTGSIARRGLVRVVFERAFNRLPPAMSKETLAEFRSTPYLDPFQQRTPELNGIARLLRDLSILEKSVAKLPLDWLENRLRTGVDDEVSDTLPLPEPAPDDTPVPDMPADLLVALEREGGELAQVAGLVRRLAAILHVPKPVTSREEMPLGGISDITNRGDPARLLMTELAWDDTTFAVRLSQGEALYTRRESPPAEPPPQRLILLDTGIFMWGKPRLFGLGAALALLRQRGAEAAGGRVLTLAVGEFTPVALATVADVRRQLGRLEPQPDPGVALALLQEEDRLPMTPQTEVFLVTHPAALDAVTRLPAWQGLALRAPLHSITVDRDGAFVLSRHSLAGGKILSQANLDLNRLLGGNEDQPDRATALKHEPGLLPQFYQQRPWPLYSPSPPEARKVFSLGQRGWVGVSSAGTINWWRIPVCAGRVLHANAPAGDLVAAAVDPDNNKAVILVFREGTQPELELLTVWLDARQTHAPLKLRTQASALRGVRLQSGALVVHQFNLVQAFSLQDGRELASAKPVAHSGQGQLWFDGEKFDLHGLGSTAEFVAGAVSRPKQAQKRQRIHDLAMAGFEQGGGRLLVQKKKWRSYALVLHDNGGLEWVLASPAGAILRPLVPMDLPGWPDHGLRHAEFPDGRRIVWDSRGFLHVLDSGKEAHQLSVVLVKGHTAAWQRRGFHYGEPNLLWDEGRGAVTSLKSITQQLFRRVPSATAGK